MRISLSLALLLALFSNPVVAQVATCHTNGDRTVCSTIDGDGPGGDGTMIGAFNKLFKADPRKKAGKLLAKGDCLGAKRVALEAGDIDLAKEVVAFCDANVSR